MLALTCERAEAEAGMRVLDLGCSWGSLAFWLAERLRAAGSSPSRARGSSERRSSRRRTGGYERIEVATADVNVFDPRKRFDRILSVELARARPQLPGASPARGLLARRRREALRPRVLPPGVRVPLRVGLGGAQLLHGGTMPPHDLLPSLAGGLRVEDEWRLDGTPTPGPRRPGSTASMRIASRSSRLAARYGVEEASPRIQMWRVFVMACAEAWGYRGGMEWGVSHYRFADG